jgi:plasmid stability protein
MPQDTSNHTRIRNIRVPDEIWEAAKVRAAERGETVTDVLTRALKRYIRQPPPAQN